MIEPRTQQVTLSFSGGSVTGTYGLMLSLFGATRVEAALGTTSQTITRQSHERVRVIGQPAQTIPQSVYTRTKWPSSTKGLAAGGEPISILVDGSWWTARLNGNHADFNAFLGPVQGADEVTAASVFWKSENGTKYGPFNP